MTRDARETGSRGTLMKYGIKAMFYGLGVMSIVAVVYCSGVKCQFGCLEILFLYNYLYLQWIVSLIHGCRWV